MIATTLKPLAWTGATDTCDGIDNNCSGDEYDAVDASLGIADTDNDGYGDASDEFSACMQPSGYVDNSDDCDDGNTPCLTNGYSGDGIPQI